MRMERPLERDSHKKLAGVAGRVPRRGILQEDALHAMLALERRRAERSRRSFVLLLLDARSVPKMEVGPKFLEQLTSLTSNATRETDIVGWHQQNEILGVIFTEINSKCEMPVNELLHSKFEGMLRDHFEEGIAAKLVVSTYVFPETWNNYSADPAPNLRIYRDLSRQASKRSFSSFIKRGMDILGSSLLLLALSPVLAVIALAIKLTSKGPVIFAQDRLGQFGKSFKFLKFRTMYINNDAGIHREYIRTFINGKSEDAGKGSGQKPIYKITSDPRVTMVGKFLRKTSLDELPQFWNVLRNDMSMVGPRPPLPYEFELYDYWHRRRVLEMKPGITGLWQVSGRSRVCFNDMVRLDLRYSESWSLLLDVKILLATPLVVLKGYGAF